MYDWVQILSIRIATVLSDSLSSVCEVLKSAHENSFNLGSGDAWGSHTVIILWSVKCSCVLCMCVNTVISFHVLSDLWFVVNWTPNNFRQMERDTGSNTGVLDRTCWQMWRTHDTISSDSNLSLVGSDVPRPFLQWLSKSATFCIVQ